MIIKKKEGWLLELFDFHAGRRQAFVEIDRLTCYNSTPPETTLKIKVDLIESMRKSFISAMTRIAEHEGRPFRELHESLYFEFVDCLEKTFVCLNRLNDCIIKINELMPEEEEPNDDGRDCDQHPFLVYGD